MWLFTRFGFYSVTVSRTDPTVMQIRAREKQHLLNLRKRFKISSRNKVIETRQTDYRFRMLVTREMWLDISRQLAEDVQYSNFKDAAHAYAGTINPYVSALHKVWNLMYDLQDLALRRKR